MAGSGTTGTATIVEDGAATVIRASVHGAPPNDVLPVRLHTGTCAEQAAEQAALEPIRTDGTGAGTMQARVELPAHQILTGQHYLQVYVALGEPHRGIACGDLPVRPDLDPVPTQP
jgi:hypothetical protein